MHAAMESSPPAYLNNTSDYRDVFEQFVTEGSFLWLLRSVAIKQPHYNLADIAALEQRITTHLHGILIAVDIGWDLCERALQFNDPGEQFTASVIALRSHEQCPIQTVIAAGLQHSRATPGLISALGWVESDISQPLIKQLLASDDPDQNYLGVAACSIRREDPGGLLSALLKRNDYLAHTRLHARLLRSIGELQREDLLPAVHAAQGSADPVIAFWANRSSILLGQPAAVNNLQPLVLQPGPLQTRAIQIAFRVLPLSQAHAWLATLNHNTANVRAAITATGVLGDPQAVNGLIENMAHPPLARLAAESFTNITGIDLIKHQLNLDPPPNTVLLPHDEGDDDVGLDEDENLPWPNVEKISALWHNQGAHFKFGQRYFLGKAITPERLQRTVAEGTMRQRHAAALELALLTASPLPNTYAKAIP